MNGCTEYEVAAVPKVARVDVIDRSYRIGLLDKLTDGSEFVGDNLTRIDTTAVGGSAFRLNTEGYDSGGICGNQALTARSDKGLVIANDVIGDERQNHGIAVRLCAKTAPGAIAGRSLDALAPAEHPP
jgi:hypothetical protein